MSKVIITLVEKRQKLSVKGFVKSMKNAGITVTLITRNAGTIYKAKEGQNNK